MPSSSYPYSGGLFSVSNRIIVCVSWVRVYGITPGGQLKSRCNVSNARQLFTDGRARRKGRAYVSWNWRDYAPWSRMLFFFSARTWLCSA